MKKRFVLVFVSGLMGSVFALVILFSYVWLAVAQQLRVETQQIVQALYTKEPLVQKNLNLINAFLSTFKDWKLKSQPKVVVGGFPWGWVVAVNLLEFNTSFHPDSRKIQKMGPHYRKIQKDLTISYAYSWTDLFKNAPMELGVNFSLFNRSLGKKSNKTLTITGETDISFSHLIFSRLTEKEYSLKDIWERIKVLKISLDYKKASGDPETHMLTLEDGLTPKHPDSPMISLSSWKSNPLALASVFFQIISRLEIGCPVSFEDLRDAFGSVPNQENSNLWMLLNALRRMDSQEPCDPVEVVPPVVKNVLEDFSPESLKEQEVKEPLSPSRSLTPSSSPSSSPESTASIIFSTISNEKEDPKKENPTAKTFSSSESPVIETPQVLEKSEISTESSSTNSSSTQDGKDGKTP